MKPLNIKPLSQRDGRWGNTKMGSSDSRLADYGCLLTALAMGLGTTPDVVNVKLEMAGLLGTKDCAACLNNFDLVKAFPLSTPVYTSTRHPYDAFPAAEITKLITHLIDGGIAALEVDGQPSIPGHQMHWVLAVGAFEIDGVKQIIVNDPWKGIQMLLCPHFGGDLGRALVRAVHYSAEMIASIPTPRAPKTVNYNFTRSTSTPIIDDVGYKKGDRQQFAVAKSKQAVAKAKARK